jgi:hypothetical protein
LPTTTFLKSSDRRGLPGYALASRCSTASRRVLAAATTFPQATGVSAALVLQGRAGRLPAAGNPLQKKARFRIAFRRMGGARSRPALAGRGLARNAEAATDRARPVHRPADRAPPPRASRLLRGNGMDPDGARAVATGSRACAIVGMMRTGRARSGRCGSVRKR